MMKDLSDAMVAAIKEEAPRLTADALRVAAEKQDNEIVALVINIAARKVEEDGAEAASEMLKRLEAAMATGNLPEVQGLTAEEMSALADAYQSAEAKDRHRVRRRTIELTNTLGRIGRVIARAALAALVV